MTVDQKVKAYRMRLNGASLEECAKKFGVSREYIRQITPPVETHARRRSNYETCIYPKIKEWLYQNRYSYSAFSKLLDYSTMSVYNALTGKVVPSKTLIDKILDATEMSYEEAFKTK